MRTVGAAHRVPTEMLRLVAVTFALASASLLPVAAARADYTLTEFTVPGAVITALFDINNSGTMVGYSVTQVGAAENVAGFVYDGVTITTLAGPAGSVSNTAVGISDGGTVVGSFQAAAGTDPNTGQPVPGPSQGFIYNGTTYMSFNVAGADETNLRGISPDGRYISGYYSTALVPGTGFVYDTVTGILTTVSTPDSLITIPQGINSAGVLAGSDIIGGTSPISGGFLYDIPTSVRTDQSIAGVERTAFRSIDDAGVISGWFRDAAGTHGFVGSVTTFEQIDFPGADLTFVEGSNNAGVLVGVYTAGSTSGAFVATPVVDPAVLLQQLADDVVGLGPGQSLYRKVELAQAYFAANDIPATCAMLMDFINEVSAQRDKKIPAASADQLIADAQAIMTEIGCN